MCGIVGIVSNENSIFSLIDGLKKLAYRGYDSAGLATLENGKIIKRKALGKINNLERLLNKDPIKFESLLPLTLKLMKEKKLPITKLVELLSYNPSKILNLNAGTLKKGNPADVVVFDPNKNIKLSSEHIKSKSNNYPYENLNAKGKVMCTIVDGKIIYNARSFNIK